MKNYCRPILAVALCSLALNTARAQNDDEERKFAESAVRIAAIEYLTDREFKLDGKQLVATARAIDPKEHVKVKLKKFESLAGRVDLKARIDARILFEGKVIEGETETDIRGEATIGQLITIEAKYWTDDHGLHVDAKATEIKFSGKVHELTPEKAAGGKAGFAKTALQQLRRQKKELLREFNDWQAKYSQNMQ